MTRKKNMKPRNRYIGAATGNPCGPKSPKPTFEDIVRAKCMSMSEIAQSWQYQNETIQSLLHYLGQYGQEVDPDAIRRVILLLQDLSKEYNRSAKQLKKISKELIISSVLE